MQPDPTQIIAGIYDVVDGESGWSSVLVSIADFCGAENAALVVVDPHLGFSHVETPRADPDVVSAYIAHWWQFDPTAIATAGTPIGQLTSLADTGRDLFLGSGFFNDFWRRSGLGSERFASNLMRGGGAFASVVLQASAVRDELDGGQADRFALFLPHLARAVSLQERMRRLEMQADIADAFGVGTSEATFVVDSRGAILHANAAAERMLSDCPALTHVDGRLAIAERDEGQRLKGALLSCANPESTRPQALVFRCVTRDGRALAVDILPYRGRTSRRLAGGIGGVPVAIIRIADLAAERAARIDHFRERFRLTRAEAALAYEMLAGDGREAAASRCGISVNTARTHLMRIFEKTGVARQAELAVLLGGIRHRRPH